MTSRQAVDFSKGSIPKNIMNVALPIIISELVHVLYNMVDRMFIGHIEGIGTAALTGVGVSLPLITVITAFSFLCGVGGMPLFSIARGKKQEEHANHIMENSFTILLLFSFVLIFLMLLLRRPLLLIIGANEESLPYAMEYFTIYLLGSTFVMISLGMNPYINAMGNSRIGMFTILIGAVVNLILDPIFIFALGMGVRGAAIATVIAQFCSAVWVTAHLTRHAPIRLRHLRFSLDITRQIISLGMSGFTFKLTNSIVQALINLSLNVYGGVESTLYIGAMSIINSLREVMIQPVSGITSATQSIMGFNYGAKEYGRVRESIRFMLFSTLSYNILVWLALIVFAPQIASAFTDDSALIAITAHSMRIYFAVFFMMSLQMTGQNTFVGLNYPKQAVFFSLFRKLIVFVPLLIILPRTALGVDGIFYSEAASQLIGSSVCFTAMLLTVSRRLKALERTEGAG